MKDIALQLKMMAESFGGMRAETESSDEGSGDFNELCQSISSEVPRIYHILNRTTTPYEVEVRVYESARAHSSFLTIIMNNPCRFSRRRA